MMSDAVTMGGDAAAPDVMETDGVECRLSQSYAEGCDDGLMTTTTTWKDYTIDHEQTPSLHLTLDDLRNGKVHSKAVSITATEAIAQFAKPGSIRSETTVNSSSLSLSDVGLNGSRATSIVENDCDNVEGWSDTIAAAPGQLVAGIWGLATWATGYGGVKDDASTTAGTPPSALEAARHAYIVAHQHRPRNNSAPNVPAAIVERSRTQRRQLRPTSHYRLDDAKLHPFPALAARQLYDVNGEALPPLRAIPVRTRSMECSTPSALFHEGSLPHRTLRFHSSATIGISSSLTATSSNDDGAPITTTTT